jgi:hypothetical protein
VHSLYQRAYFTSEMSPPAEDGFGLFRQWYGETALTINPFHRYPWEKTLVRGKPLVTSQELAIGYRFHDLIPEEFPIIDKDNNVVQMKRVSFCCCCCCCCFLLLLLLLFFVANKQTNKQTNKPPCLLCIVIIGQRYHL